MKTIHLTIGLLAAACFLLAAQPAFCQLRTDPYVVYFDKEVGKCEQKVVFLSSKSPNLRDEGKRANFKLNFLREYRNDLIADMKKENIEAKDYQVSHFLTERFLETYSPFIAAGQKQVPLW